MPTPGILDIFLVQGASDTLAARWIEDDSPVDLSAWAAELQVRASFSSSDLLLSLGSAGGDIVLDDDGRVVVTFLPETSSLLSVSPKAAKKKHEGGLYYFVGRYNLELSDGPENVVRLLEGDFYVNPEIVR